MADSQRKTANLFDKGSQNWKVGYRIDDEGNEVSSQIAQYSQNRIEVSPSSKYTAFGFYPDGTSLSNSGFKLYCYDANDVWIENISASLNSPKEFTMPDNCHYIRIQVTTAYYTPNTAMINEGSTALPYEPYGWQHSLRKLGTSTDTITTLPADIYANDTTATVGLKGDMQQSSQPSPTTPIQPSECGERTGNLFDWNWLVNGYHLDPQTGLPTAHSMRVSILQPIDVSQLTSAILSYESVNVETLYAMYSVLTTDNTLIRRVTSVPSGSELDLSGGDKLYIAFYNGAPSGATAITKDNITNIMLNTGSTALPYEPYGYKIPILSNSTTTPVYLGEVESARRIRKLVLTGEETFGNYTKPPRTGVYLDISDLLSERDNGYCTHFVPVRQPNQFAVDGITFGASNSVLYITFSSATAATLNLTDLDSITAWFRQQYAAGTPVTVWYVLAEPTTGIVNEPLRKIGNYADTVSGITIPTITGADSFDVLTTLKPSEVDLTYTGWHDASVKEKSAQLIPEIVQGGVSTSDGSFSDNSARVRTNYISVESGKTYAVNSGNLYLATGCYYNNGVFRGKIDEVIGVTQTASFTVPENVNQIAIGFRTADGTTNITPSDLQNYMLNEGGTVLPYEPYWK